MGLNSIIYFHQGSFQKKKNDETYGKFHMLGGGVQGGHFPYVIRKDFYCILSYFKPFQTLFSPLYNPPQTFLLNIRFSKVWKILHLFEGKNKSFRIAQKSWGGQPTNGKFHLFLFFLKAFLSEGTWRGMQQCNIVQKSL